MATIPAESKAFIKPFEGTDVTCLILDVVAWFGADEIVSIINQNLCHHIKSLPSTLKATWKQLEPQVQSEKQFINSLGVRLLIAKTLHGDVPPLPPPICSSASPSQPSCASYYNNMPINTTSSLQARVSGATAPAVAQITPPITCYELAHTLHKLGNIFINEAIFDSRAYPLYEEINIKTNRIYNILLQRDLLNTSPISSVTPLLSNVEVLS
ncbi:pep-1 [Cnaphalocrocis medinalis granulovirus]|uniref:Pep n=1 Tax=Cnaphalocrocis medinalis granulovirus TaxID=1750712 RepID=A0A0X9GJP3_9BBAC|nr:pep-1 [Cnaphalocrocis medinalis granulovirus]ALN41953.1 pep [Cnaphalocrocis medinalis granulovirus]AMF83768.1 pep-1 [Cnaphalocrocis medinalis granulovirus]